MVFNLFPQIKILAQLMPGSTLHLQSYFLFFLSLYFFSFSECWVKPPIDGMYLMFTAFFTQCTWSSQRLFQQISFLLLNKAANWRDVQKNLYTNWRFVGFDFRSGFWALVTRHGFNLYLSALNSNEIMSGMNSILANSM